MITKVDGQPVVASGDLPAHISLSKPGERVTLEVWRQGKPEQLTAQLAESLRQNRVLWLDHGYLEGDDTDAHIDTLARFAAPDAIVFQACDDPTDSHYADLQAMAGEGGMVDLRQDGIAKAVAGKTSLAEVGRVLYGEL